MMSQRRAAGTAGRRQLVRCWVTGLVKVVLLA
jgi:hypothetical protein